MTAPSLAGLFSESLVAMIEAMTPVEVVRPETTREVHLEADSLEELLVDWLTEALGIFEVEELLPCGADLDVRPEDGAWRLDGSLAGERFDPERHESRVAVKAVTYHDLAIGESAEGWRAAIVFDI